ncbi:MAG TPA: pyrroloquinoline quinone-dependent dehydrogenase [Casimicrobiaceae bacterium]|nr:pyrroloquinoline quinone-dependent dehydrogenase [Casimicrobiaceae bacterium]
MRGRWRALLPCLALAAAVGAQDPGDGWGSYGGDPGGTRYSQAKKITRDNVAKLAPAWEYKTGDVSDGSGAISATSFQATPILFEDTLYLCSPFNRIIALDPRSGAARWTYDPKVDIRKDNETRKTDGAPLRCRGVAAWSDKDAAAGAACATRIFEGVIDGRLIAVDAKSGRPCTDFGKGGAVDLNTLANLGVGQVNMSSPPAIFENLVIVGSAIGDNVRNDMPHGFVRAFDARSGKLAWSWDPIPAALAGKTGAGNTWAPISVDVARGLVVLPTSSPSPDYFGGERTAEMPYTTAVVTLNARTGERIWHFQVVRHNLWDYDLASQPALVTIRRDGAAHDAVAQATKMGFVYVLDRETGAPLFPIVERPAPRSSVRGEVTAPSQPVPILPRPIARQAIRPEDAWGVLYFDAKACERKLAGLDNEGLYTPPSERGSVVLPFFGGGSNWGSVAYDPVSNLLVANTMNVVGMAQVVPRAQFADVAKAHPDDEATAQRGTPYGMRRKIVASFLGVPCNPPPWGELSAIDLATGEIRWRVPLGQVKKGPFYTFEHWGSPNIGGPLVTAGGLVFIAATMDKKIRAFDLQNGTKVWEARLPAFGMATPMTYESGGRQYVVIAAGGHGALGGWGDSVIAFTLPAP